MAESLHGRKARTDCQRRLARSEHKSELPSGGRRSETHRANQIGCCQPKASTRSTRVILALYTNLRRQATERETERGRGADGHRSVFRRPSYFWSFRVLTVWNFHVATSENPAKRRAETDDTTSLLNCHTQCGQDTESQEGDAPPIDKDLHFCSPVFRFSSGWSTPATENRGGTGSLLDLEELDLEDEGRVGGDDGREATLATVGTGHDQQV